MPVRIQLPLFLPRFEHTNLTNDRPTYFTHGRILTGAHHCKQCRTISRAFLVFEDGHRLAENVREHLLPERAACAATREAHRVNRDVHFLNDVQTIFLAVGDTFEQRSNEIGTRMFSSKANPTASSEGIEMWCPFTH